MANYYALISGLPDLYVDQNSVEISSQEYIQILNDTLTKSDKKLLDIVLYDKTINEVASAIEKGIVEPIDDDIDNTVEGYSVDIINEMNLICYQAKEELPLSKPDKNSVLPNFIREFVYEYYKDEENYKNKYLSILDALSVKYFDFAENYKREFIRDWFSLNRNIRNILAAYTCKKLNWNIDDYILGNSEIEKAIRESSAKDFGLSDEIDYISDIIDIAEETDIAKRERKIDILKWNWLDEYNFAKVFDIDNVISYYIRLTIIERWLNLNKQKGEETFRNIVKGLKESSRESLQEFKDKQRK